MIYELVKKQHQHFNILYKGRPRHLSFEEKKFYVTAINEELNEYAAAKSFEDEYDALLDLVVFTIGALLRHGFPPEGIHEVVRANMEKVIGTNEKRNDFELDLIKPMGWLPPNLTPFLVKGIFHGK